MAQKCPMCRGSGRCQPCGGSGWGPQKDERTGKLVIDDCRYCKGLGRCEICGGKGTIE